MKSLRKGLIMTMLLLTVLAIGIFAAGCKTKTVTISFDTDGANEIYESFEIEPGKTFELKVPTKEGSEFIGWYDNAERTGVVYRGTIKAPAVDTTYYASWARYQTVTLNLGGGVIDGSSETITISVQVGNNLIDEISSYNPTRGGLEFAGWYESDAPIVDGYKMPNRPVTLVARFYVGYTVEVYKQLSSEGGYEKDAALGYKDKGFVDTSLRIEAKEIEGYNYNDNYYDNRARLTLSENAADNLFKLYYDKGSSRIIYNVNAPVGVNYSGFMPDQFILYGEKGVAQECGFVIAGYRFAGWATSKDGDVVYAVGAELPEGARTLYAVWDEGFKDIFGGSDYIYFPHGVKTGKAYLQRGNTEIPGTTMTIDEDENKYVEAIDGEFVNFGGGLMAKLNETSPKSFAFYNADIRGLYEHYSPYFGATSGNGDEIYLDGYYTMYLTEGENGKTYEYTYSYDTATRRYKLQANNGINYFEIGLKDGKNVYTFVGAEEDTYMEVARNSVTGFSGGNYSYALDGLGNVRRINVNSGAVMMGRYEEPVVGELATSVVIHLDNGEIVEINLLRFETMNGALVKDAFAGEYASGENTLTLSGFSGYEGTAIYNGADYDYYVEETILGNIVHLIQSYRVIHHLRLEANNTFVELIDDSFTIYQRLYTAESGNTVGDVYLVVYNKPGTKGQAAEVVRKTNDGYKTLYTGYVMDDEEHIPLNRFVAETTVNWDAIFPYKDFAWYGSTRFSLGAMFYVYLERDINSEYPTYMYFEEENGNGDRLLVYSGMNTYAGYGLEGIGSFYLRGDEVLEGSFDVIYSEYTDPQTGKEVIPEEVKMMREYFGVKYWYTFTYYDSNNNLNRLYFALNPDEETKTYTFFRLNDMPRLMHVVMEEMESPSSLPYSGAYSLLLDGNGNGYYSMDTGSGVYMLSGTYSATAYDNAGNPQYTFVVNDADFPELKGTEVEFVISSLSEIYYHLKSTLFPKGTYSIINGGSVYLDGWGTYARVIDQFGHVYEGNYCFYPKYAAFIVYEGTTGLIEVYNTGTKDENGQTIFRTTSPEAMNSNSFFVDQNYAPFEEFPSAIVIFDGKAALSNNGMGGVEIVEYVSYNTWLWGGDPNKPDYTVYARGSYSILSEDEYMLYVGILDKNGNHTRTEQWRVKLANGNCIVIDENTRGSYIGEDNSVLYFDGYGDGFYVDSRGFRSEGIYMILDEKEGIAVFQGDRVYMVKTNKSGLNYTFSMLTDPSKFITYYADDFTAVEFTYTVRVNGADMAYWYSLNGEIVVYEIDETGAFVKTDKYAYNEPTIVLNDKTYTLWKENQALTFEGEIIFNAFADRANGKITDARLTFTPDGTSELNAKASLSFTNFGDEESKSYVNVYEIRRQNVDTLQGNYIYTAFVLNLCYGDMRLQLQLDRATQKFTLWAQIDAVRELVDYQVYAGGGFSYGDLVLGSGYTIGIKSWDAASIWDTEDMIIGGTVNAADEHGDLIRFDVLYEEYFGMNGKASIVAEGASALGNVYEVPATSLTGDQKYAILFEIYGIYYELYNVSYLAKGEITNANDLDGDFTVYMYRTVGSYVEGFSYMKTAYVSVYMNEGDEDVRISDGYSMFLLPGMNKPEYVLFEGTDVEKGASYAVFNIAPTWIDDEEDEYSYYLKTNDDGSVPVELLFGVYRKIEDPQNGVTSKAVAFNAVLLTNQYRAPKAEDTDNRAIVSSWVVSYFISAGGGYATGRSWTVWGNGARHAIIQVVENAEYYKVTFGGTMAKTSVHYEETENPVAQPNEE